MKTIKAWYFSGADKKLRYGDGRKIKIGVTHKFEGNPVLCECGLHGSIKPLYALQYAPGPVVWRVELSGEMNVGANKIAAAERKYLWGYDATNILRAFVRKCALDVVPLWNAPEIVIKYLKMGDESIRAAASDAAWNAAWAAAGAAAWAAAWDAAWATAWAAARAAARAAAGTAVREKQNTRLYRMLMDGRKK